MTDVVLVDFSRSMSFEPHLVHNGFRYLASFLRSKGLKVKILFDPSLSREKIFEGFIREIKKEKPLLLGFSPIEGQIPLIHEFVRRAKKSRIKALMVVGGHSATFNHDKILEDFKEFDVIVRGEGEETLFEITHRLKAKRTLAGVLGVTYREGGEIRVNEPRPNIQDLDRLPFPAIDGFLNAQKRGYKIGQVYISSSRGCYGNCSFCSIQRFYKCDPSSRPWRARSPRNVVAEIKGLQEKFDVTDFTFIDDNFMGPGKIGKQRAILIAKKILDQGLKIKFTIPCRSNDVDEEVIRQLKKAGLVTVLLGIESGFQRALNTFNKGTSLGQNERALRILAKNKVNIMVDFIFFDPYMTPKELLLNVAYLQKLARIPGLKFDQVLPFTRLVPCSGTPIKDKLEKEGLLIGDYISGFAFKFMDERVAVLAGITESVKEDLRKAQRKIYKNILDKKRPKASLRSLCSRVFFRHLKLLKGLGKALDASKKKSFYELYSNSGVC